MNSDNHLLSDFVNQVSGFLKIIRAAPKISSTRKESTIGINVFYSPVCKLTFNFESCF